jgi:ribosome-binding factor A
VSWSVAAPLLCWLRMAGGDRMRRIDEVMRKIVGTAIASDLEDPRIGFVTVTAVHTSPDLRSARVYVSVLGDESEREATLAGLRASHGKLQGAIAREVRIKHTPTLTFHYDEGPERALRLTRLLEDDE